MQATIGNLCPELAAVVKNAEVDASAALREERKLRRFMGYQKEPSVYEKINVTEGCRIGRKDAVRLSQAISVDREAYGRICRQDPAGITQDPTGWNGWRRDWEQEANPINGGFPKRANKTMANGDDKNRVADTRKRVKGFQVPGLPTGSPAQRRTNNPAPPKPKAEYMVGAGERKAKTWRPMKGIREG
jgi:hypothetical protein